MQILSIFIMEEKDIKEKDYKLKEIPIDKLADILYNLLHKKGVQDFLKKKLKKTKIPILNFLNPDTLTTKEALIKALQSLNLLLLGDKIIRIDYDIKMSKGNFYVKITT